MNSLPETVIRQRRDCDLNPGPTVPESSTLDSMEMPFGCGLRWTKGTRYKMGARLVSR